MSDTLPKIYPLHRSTLVLMVLALGVVITSLIASLYFFLAFLDDDRSYLGVLQAFILCFGLGTLFYLPASVLFFMTRHMRRYGPKPSIGLAAVLISLPLWIYGAIGMFIYPAQWIITGLCLISGLALLRWGIAVMGHKPPLTDT